MSLPTGVHLTSPPPKGTEQILTPDALSFLAVLHRTFNDRRKELLANRKKVQAELDKVGEPFSLAYYDAPLTRRASPLASCQRPSTSVRARHGPALHQPRASRTVGACGCIHLVELPSPWGKNSVIAEFTGANDSVEITGPTDRKMVINALNSGAKTFMTDFEGELACGSCDGR